MVYLKSAQQIEKIRKSCRLVARALELAGQSLKPGLTTGDLDKLVGDYIVSNGGLPANLNYTESGSFPPFPAACRVSVNEEVVHGIPGPRKILDGDLVTVDTTVILDGYYGDAARTFLVGKASQRARRLTEAAEEALRLGMAEARDGARLGDIGQAIQAFVESMGYSVVRDFTGHGVGLEMHEAPAILHYGQRGRGTR
ncbi:MAG: type I methionyl aminopeptidase, partial [Deltaproteobacteria bacterium]|nr:type I methionyl aminopeptidase [Deltaproteobacteria bacterium]